MDLLLRRCLGWDRPARLKLSLAVRSVRSEIVGQVTMGHHGSLGEIGMEIWLVVWLPFFEFSQTNHQPEIIGLLFTHFDHHLRKPFWYFLGLSQLYIGTD